MKLDFSLSPLGYIRTCFPEKFGIPRQPLLAPSAKGELVLLPPFNDSDCVEGLEKSSHLWLTFIFHQHLDSTQKAKVRPPRLGGNKKCGVFATRSSFRPNALGLSAVKLEDIKTINNEVILFFSGVDLLDGTPIVDIKPYVPYSDAIIDATNVLADSMPEICDVIFTKEAVKICREYPGPVDLYSLIKEVLQQDPRPAYQAIDPDRVYKMKLLDVDVEWCCRELNGKKTIDVLTIKTAK